MTERILYEKRGEEYIPISVYDAKVYSAYPIGEATLVVADANFTMRKYKVEPALAPMVAAAMLLEPSLDTLLAESSGARLEDQNRGMNYTEKQVKMWKKMCKELNLTSVQLPSNRAISERILEAIKTKAEELLKDKNVAAAYEDFLLIATMGAKND